MEEKSVRWCSEGRYVIGSELDQNKFELIAELNKEKIYKCKQNGCEGCEYLAIIYRNDSDAGLAGSCMAISAYQREFGQQFEKAVAMKKKLEVMEP